MEQYPTDRNRWEIELREDESFVIERIGWPLLTEEEQRFFNRLESWHQAFFLSLSRHPRLKLSLTKVLVRDSEADKLYWKYAEIREFLLSPIMKIHQISALVFPLIEYDVERTILEDQIIEAIEKWGLKAGGLNWQDMYSNVAASEEEQLQDLIKNYTKEGMEKRRQNFLYSAVNINDLEALAKTGALHWSSIKYLRVWRYFLQDKNRATGAPPLSTVIIPNNENLKAIQPTISGTSTNTPDGLPIPWLMKKIQREGGIASMLKAAYMAFRLSPKERNPDQEELWQYLTPENLPEFISKRNKDGLILADSNRTWTRKDFLTAYPYWFNARNSE